MNLLYFGFEKLRGLGKTRHKKIELQRMCYPEATLEQVRNKLSILGITRIADITGLDNIGIPVFLVVRPNSRSLVVSQGKGTDAISARISGILEAAEAYHAERFDLPLLLARFSELVPSSRVVDPSLLPRISDSCFTPDLRLPWAEAFDIGQESEIFVPMEMVHTDFTRPPPPGSGCFPMSSNGLASGNCIGEAVIHGIAEVIERDAFALWRASGGASAQAMELKSITHPYIRELVEKIYGAGCELLVEEITSDIGVPVFMATLWGGRGASPVTSGSSGGLACHPDRNIACMRAITEAAQSRLTRIAGSRDDLDDEVFKSAAPNVNSPPPGKHFADGPGFESDVIEEDLDWLLNRLRSTGFEQVLAVDLTRQDVGIPVARVIIPGLEGPPSSKYVPGARALHARR